ncbi:glycosyltransferase [Litorivivens sp.]|uniref:glycosyltransferase n=1 Tax=Litorivivens sp. TaxID=2020868 RepID=UPI0035625A47
MPDVTSYQPHRTLLIGHADRDVNFDWLYRYLGEYDDLDVAVLEKPEIKAFPKTFKRLQGHRYDRVILDLPFSKIRRFSKNLKTIPNLVIFEEDACQNFLPASRWYGAFTEYYQDLPQATLILTGFATAARFRQQGIESRVIPKGFDQHALSNTQLARDIPLGFIGRVRSDVYRERRELLESVDQTLGVTSLRTHSQEEYRDTLNRIEVFISADIGLGEYMAKNFEAMACGCVLVAARQGAGEEEALGFKDMENIVLYDSADEAIEKIQQLRQDNGLRTRIAKAGEAHALSRFSHQHIADQILAIAREPLSIKPEQPSPSWWRRLLKRQ